MKMPDVVGCELELTSQSSESPGVVEGHEQVCRGIRSPIDLKHGQVTDNPFKTSELSQRRLSVYRQAPRCFTQSGVIDKLKGWASEKPNQSLHSIYRAQAVNIRSKIIIEKDGVLYQSICIVDEVEPKGNVFHAHLGFFEAVQSRLEQKLARDQLKFMMEHEAIYLGLDYA